MKVKVRLNGVMCAKCDWRERDFTLDEASTVIDLKAAIEREENSISFEALRASTIVNEEIVPDGHTLSDSDNVSFLPPLAGG